ncbi:MAG TPA: hypothetical protein VE955_07975 [Candidatus Dormibacteraeota bacterium]|jgi:hypothetical protein|nr:hypothetical protein [Candidatus Dormibacteraeota bacterium]
MATSPPRPGRPTGVSIIAIIAAAGGLLSLFASLTVLFGAMAGNSLVAVIVLFFGVLGLILGFGFLTGARWAWIAGITIYVASIVLGIIEIIYGGNVGFLGGIIRIIAGIVIPVYLMRQGPKSFFGKSP